MTLNSDKKFGVNYDLVVSKMELGKELGELWKV